MKGDVSTSVGEFNFFDGEGIGFEVAVGAYPAEKFAGFGARIGLSEKGRKEALQPVWAGTRAEPEVEIGGVKMIGVELKLPIVAGGVVESGRIADRARPRGAEC